MINEVIMKELEALMNLSFEKKQEELTALGKLIGTPKHDMIKVQFRGEWYDASEADVRHILNLVNDDPSLASEFELMWGDIGFSISSYGLLKIPDKCNIFSLHGKQQLRLIKQQKNGSGERLFKRHLEYIDKCKEELEELYGPYYYND